MSIFMNGVLAHVHETKSALIKLSNGQRVAKREVAKRKNIYGKVDHHRFHRSLRIDHASNASLGLTELCLCTSIYF